MQEINKKVLEIAQKELTQVSYNTWINNPVKSAILDEKNNIVMKVKNEFEFEVIKDRYFDLLKNCYKQYINFNAIEFVIVDKKEVETEITEEVKSVGDAFIMKTAKEYREIATKSREKLVDVKKEAEKLLLDLCKTIEVMATKGEFRTSYLIGNYYNDDIINAVINELNDKGYITDVVDFSGGRKTISVSWE